MNFFIIFFHIYNVKMSENLAAKHYKENKKKLQKKLIKDTKTFPKEKEKKKKSDTIWWQKSLRR